MFYSFTVFFLYFIKTPTNVLQSNLSYFLETFLEKYGKYGEKYQIKII